jgi:hypothetical protein
MRVPENRLAASAIVALVLALTLAFASGCTSDGDEEPDAGRTNAAAEQGGDVDEAESEEAQGDAGEPDAAEAGTLSWVDIELTDVVTGETFRVSDFAGEQVLVESFAVW